MVQRRAMHHNERAKTVHAPELVCPLTGAQMRCVHHIRALVQHRVKSAMHSSETALECYLNSITCVSN